ncbi:MAG TPA: response regulator [Polyangiaceae bacterium]|nr:response regulator [Polyangiaceae bacterium]
MTADPFKYFRVEGRELSAELGRALLALEKGQDPELVQRLLRLAHTLKGAARVVKHRAIAQNAHSIEELLGPLRDQAVKASKELVDDALKLVDAISRELNEIDAPTKPDVGAPASPAPTDDFHRTMRVDVDEMDALLEGISEASARLRSLRSFDDVLEQMERLTNHAASKRVSDAEERGHAAGAGARSPLDELRALAQSLRRAMSNGLEQAERELVDVHDRAERLRFLPAGILVASLERTVRDGAQAVGKRAALQTKGGDVRLDARVLGAVQGALIQLVRNAVAHGIESAPERSNAGKPASGRVNLEIVRHGNRIAFRCSDDGRGIDLRALRAAAQKKGLVSAGGAPADSRSLLDLLLKGGLTTSDSVTELSGRGIGLDIVRETAKRLDGSVSVHTDPGIGTTFELTVPMALASLDALTVEAGGTTASIPLEAVRRAVALRPADFVKTPDGECVQFEGATIPFLSLASVLPGCSPVEKSRGGPILVVDGAGALAAIGVDRLLGASTIVARTLPTIAAADSLFASASFDEKGIPRPVLDPASLALLARQAQVERETAATTETRPILVIDDSLTTRMLEQGILEAAGYAVDLATSAEQALEMAAERDYALFLVDVEMPGMDGFSFVEKTRADAKLRTVPAILVSSRNAPEDLRRGRDVGARAYIVKSEFDQGRLLHVIQELVGS